MKELRSIIDNNTIGYIKPQSTVSGSVTTALNSSVHSAMRWDSTERSIDMQIICCKNITVHDKLSKTIVGCHKTIFQILHTLQTR